MVLMGFRIKKINCKLFKTSVKPSKFNKIIIIRIIFGSQTKSCSEVVQYIKWGCAMDWVHAFYKQRQGEIGKKLSKS